MRKHLLVVESCGLSHVGPVRTNNQDAIYLPNRHSLPWMGQLFVVADGMGGYAHGALASSLAIEKLIEALPVGDRKLNLKDFRRGVEYANTSIYKTAQKLGAGKMGTTLTAAYIFEDDLQLIHVGDCRAYLIRKQRAICLTSDHTTVGDLVRTKLIKADKIRTHSQRSILTKAVGIGLFVKPDISQFALQQNDRLILCSDGIWSVVQDDEFARIIAESSEIDQVGRDLVDLALGRNTDDNVSVIAIHIKDLQPVLPGKNEHTGLGWFRYRRKLVR